MKKTIVPRSMRASVLREIAQFRSQRGGSLKHACSQLGYSYLAVNKWREERQSPEEQRLQQAVELYDRGLSIEEAAQRAGIVAAPLVQWLKARRQKKRAAAWRASEKLQAKTGYVTA